MDQLKLRSMKVVRLVEPIYGISALIRFSCLSYSEMNFTFYGYRNFHLESHRFDDWSGHLAMHD